MRDLLHSPNGADVPLLILRYIAEATDQLTAERLFEAFEHIAPEIQEQTMTVAEELRLKGLEQGRAEGRAESRAQVRNAVLGVLEARGIPLTASQRQRVEACDDLELLGRWVRLAVTLSDPEELFG